MNKGGLSIPLLYKQQHDVVTTENIPVQLVMNWDQTAINLVPSFPWTMETKGKRRIVITGLSDK